MPFPLIHLKIATLLNDFPQNNFSQFYLGSIAPDAIHMRKNATRDDKRKIHFFQVDKIDERFCLLNNFYINYKKKIHNYSFFLGYVGHLATDFLWLYLLNWYYKYTYKKDLTKKERDNQYYSETKYLDKLLYNQDKTNYDNIFNCLQNIDSTGFADLLSSQEITNWKNEIVQNDYSIFENINLDFFTQKRAIRFIEISIEVLKYCFQNDFCKGVNYLQKKYKEGYLATEIY